LTFEFWNLDLFEIMNMKKLKKGERGFSLVELVIVVALAGLVGVAITATAFQVFTFSTRLSNQMTAVRQVQQAGFWVSPDVMMSEPGKINVNPGGGKFLVLGWTAHDDTVHEVVYSLVDISGGVARLQREHYIGPDPDSLTIDSTTIVAEYIDPTTSFVPVAGGAYDFTVTATVGGQTETRIYEVKPRVGS
jgi:prepilin-type N-terminal cleavage/methylation domain-containing protein